MQEASQNTISVSDLNKYLEGKFAHDENLKNVTLKGEVSNFTNHLKSGHYFFSLKDDKSAIKAIMYKGKNAKVKFKVENGMNLIVTGTVSVFPRDGMYQIYCDTLEPDGVGSLYLALEQLKEELGARNYFNPDIKKPLPRLPKNIGIVTSPTGAALQDILNVLNRRYPIGEVTLFPTLVQGENAGRAIANSIKKAEEVADIDVLIVGRGGGSIEDLWAFNEEVVATAIYKCSIPVISAVGHEVDFTISDMVADTRAPTPSAAAEIVAPNIENIENGIKNMERKLDELAQTRIYTSYQRILSTYNRMKANSPENKLDLAESDLESKTKRLDNCVTQMIAMREQRMESIESTLDNSASQLVDIREQRMMSVVSTLEALSPLKVLTRGYSITYDEKGNIISDKEQVNSGDKIITKLAETEITSIVE